MSDIYTDADLQAAVEGLWTNWGEDPKSPPADCEWAARIVLDAVAPAIAARALREAASKVRRRTTAGNASIGPDGRRLERRAIATALRAKANEYERATT